jgi:hypothetical protein
MNARLFIYPVSDPYGGNSLRYLYAFVGLFVLLGMACAAGNSLPAHSPVLMDVDTYVDASSANESFGGNDTLWVSSAGGKPGKETYLSFVNDFADNGISSPDQIETATLMLNVAKVETPGKIMAYFVEGPTTNVKTWADKPEYDTSVSTSLEVKAEGESSMDVTPIIKKAISACGECGYSIALVADDSTSVGVVSKEASEENKLILRYTLASK